MLDRNRSYKPLDFGNGLVAGSVNDQGRLVALNTCHPEQGYVTLTNLPPFPDDRWYDPAFVREYRAKQASPDLPGFGFHFGDQASYPAACSIDLPAMPTVQLELAPGIKAEIVTFAPFGPDSRPITEAIQLCTLTNERDEPYRLNFSWQGELALTRASYAQLTEGGPIPRPHDVYQTREVGTTLTIENKELGQTVAIVIAEVVPDSYLFKPFFDWQITDNQEKKQLSLKLPATLTLEAHSNLTLITIYAFVTDSEEVNYVISGLAGNELKEQTARHWQRLDHIGLPEINELPGAAWFIRQNLAYILGCCAVPLENGSVCMITDHQLLPLAWTRDAYYAIQALLALRKQAKASTVPEASDLITELDHLIKQHLIWLFEVAERPQGYWGRAYLTNGRCKDFIFQLDQQCYPLLELADYTEVTGDKALAQRLKPQIENALVGLLARRADEAWLFPTGETPADDKVELPYHLSSQITVWRMLIRLAELEMVENYNEVQLRDMAEQIRQDVYKFMVAENQGQKMFCYLTDLNGSYRFYHDANDWPTTLAPLWGFCSKDDPVWQATLNFGFSEANQGGYYSGQFGGLGSVHTPHPWPLGDFQELLLARLQKDKVRAIKVWSKVLRIACWDGTFPEAYDEQSGQVASRHWFAWPGAMLSATNNQLDS
jgi:hypothetical protein